METQKPSNSTSRLDTRRDEPNDTRETILVGIDGTSEVLDEAYAHTMHNSFVQRIVNESSAEMKQYIRGPGGDGLDMMVLVGKGHEFVHLHKFVKPTAKVLLTGYSRGGAGVVGVAQRLKREGVKVDAMILFDPVNRSQTSSADDVPNNVLNMVQARRATRSYSRISFNNCAVYWHSPTQCVIKYFWATHGGIGGVPWPVDPGHSPKEYIDEDFREVLLTETVYHGLEIPWEQPRDYTGTIDQLIDARARIGNRTQVTYEQDRWGADAVWDWVYPRLLQYGFLSKKK